MALTPWQKTRALDDGGKDLANSKRQYAQLATTIRKLAKEAERGSDQAAALSAEEVETMMAAAALADRVAHNAIGTLAYKAAIKGQSPSALSAEVLAAMPAAKAKHAAVVDSITAIAVQQRMQAAA